MWLQTNTKDKCTGGNMRLASCGVTCINSNLVFQINFCAGQTVLCSENPHERQAQERYRQVLTTVLTQTGTAENRPE